MDSKFLMISKPHQLFQHPDFISQDLGMDKSKVLDILKVLSDEGRIDDFDFDEETKVKKFNEIFRTYNS